jgi:hypothetical protein
MWHTRARRGGLTGPGGRPTPARRRGRDPWPPSASPSLACAGNVSTLRATPAPPANAVAQVPLAPLQHVQTPPGKCTAKHVPPAVQETFRHCEPYKPAANAVLRVTLTLLQHVETHRQSAGLNRQRQPPGGGHVATLRTAQARRERCRGMPRFHCLAVDGARHGTSPRSAPRTDRPYSRVP